MNIFITDFDPQVAVLHLDDSRIRKMNIETAQIVSTALREEWGINSSYKSTHKGHPCTKWAQRHQNNLSWLVNYGYHIGREFIHRFGKPHASSFVNAEQRALIDQHNFTRGEVTPFQNSARNGIVDCTHMPIPFSYRSYLNLRWAGDKRHPKWTNREMPEWASFEWKGKDCDYSLLTKGR